MMRYLPGSIRSPNEFVFSPSKCLRYLKKYGHYRRVSPSIPWQQRMLERLQALLVEMLAWYLMLLILLSRVFWWSRRRLASFRKP